MKTRTGRGVFGAAVGSYRYAETVRSSLSYVIRESVKPRSAADTSQPGTLNGSRDLTSAVSELAKRRQATKMRLMRLITPSHGSRCTGHRPFTCRRRQTPRVAHGIRGRTGRV